MTKLTPTQDMLLRNVQRSDQAYRNAYQNEHARARIEADRRIEAARLKADLDVIAADDGGVPKAVIAREGMGVPSGGTTGVYAAIKRARAVADAAPTETDPYAEVFEWDAIQSYLNITPPAEELAATLRTLDWDAATVAADSSLRFASFEVLGTGSDPKRLQALTPDFLPAYGNRHPVVVWAYRSENEAKAVAWLAEHHPYAVPAESEAVAA